MNEQYANNIPEELKSVVKTVIIDGKIRYVITGEIVDVKAAQKIGASWQVGIPKEICEHLGINKKKAKVVFFKNNNILYMANAHLE